jgi:hypothetical protein
MMAQDEMDELLAKKEKLEADLISTMHTLLTRFSEETGWYVNHIEVGVVEATAIKDSQPSFYLSDVSTRLTFITKSGERVFIS